MDPYTWKHKGETITIDPIGWFCTSLDATSGDERKTYESLKAAQDSIDRGLALNAAEARKNIALPALSSHGTPCVITGIRRGSGALLVTPKEDADYPDTPQVRLLLSKKSELDKETTRLWKLLQTACIGGQYAASYPQRSDADYPAAIAKLQADYAKAWAVAQTLVVEGEKA